MNKDALLATAIGFGVGLVVTGTVLYGPSLVKNIRFPKLPSFSISLPNFFNKPSPTPTNTPPPKDHTVTIESPLADSLEQSDTVLVSGSTSPKATVVISGLVDEAVVIANDEGKYAGKVTLVEGKNPISVAGFSAQGKELTQQVNVFYIKETW